MKTTTINLSWVTFEQILDNGYRWKLSSNIELLLQNKNSFKNGAIISTYIVGGYKLMKIFHREEEFSSWATYDTKCKEEVDNAFSANFVYVGAVSGEHAITKMKSLLMLWDPVLQTIFITFYFSSFRILRQLSIILSFYIITAITWTTGFISFVIECWPLQVYVFLANKSGHTYIYSATTLADFYYSADDICIHLFFLDAPYKLLYLIKMLTCVVSCSLNFSYI